MQQIPIAHAKTAQLKKRHRNRIAFRVHRMERVKGIEPSLSGWEPGVLPLNYTRPYPRQEKNNLFERDSNITMQAPPTMLVPFPLSPICLRSAPYPV